MAFLQSKLSLKVAQRQILTPGLMQMVSVLALNKLELKEMINAEIVENPVLEEVEEHVPLLDEMAGREADRERPAEEKTVETSPEERDPFEEIDFGSYFQDYLDPGYRTGSNFEISEKPSFENFLSVPEKLADHLNWQLGSLDLEPDLREAAEYIIGNLNEDGYLGTGIEELISGFSGEPLPPAVVAPLPGQVREPEKAPGRFDLASAQEINGHPSNRNSHGPLHAIALPGETAAWSGDASSGRVYGEDLAGTVLSSASSDAFSPSAELTLENDASRSGSHTSPAGGHTTPPASMPPASPVALRLMEALQIVRRLDPVGIAACNLRECLLLQIASQRREFELIFSGTGARNASRQAPSSAAGIEQDGPSTLVPGQTGVAAEPQQAPDFPDAGALPETDPTLVRKKLACFDAAVHIITDHLLLLQKRDNRDLAKLINRSAAEMQEAVELIRTLDPKPGQRYNRPNTRLIEPDVAFVKRGDEIAIVMNEDDMPTLRLNHGYKKLLTQSGTEKDVKDYVKERYRSALQLMRNIEQRKSTILRTCEAIIRRQPEFMEHGVEALRPMMIKDVAEEIGVHPSTVSRAVSNKYVHTAQGVFELRFFFSEAVNGPEGAATPLLLLKRKVKKLIEDEDPQKPFTDDQIAAMLQTQGIRVTRRTVAKYREDLNIPSTHQRRVRA